MTIIVTPTLRHRAGGSSTSLSTSPRSSKPEDGRTALAWAMKVQADETCRTSVLRIVDLEILAHTSSTCNLTVVIESIGSPTQAGGAAGGPWSPTASPNSSSCAVAIGRGSRSITDQPARNENGRNAHDDGADLPLIQSKKVAIIGYGSQGHARAEPEGIPS